MKTKANTSSTLQGSNSYIPPKEKFAAKSSTWKCQLVGDTLVPWRVHGGPLPVRSGVLTPINGLVVTGVIANSYKWSDMGPYSIHWFLGPTEGSPSTSQMVGFSWWFSSHGAIPKKNHQQNKSELNVPNHHFFRHSKKISPSKQAPSSR